MLVTTSDEGLKIGAKFTKKEQKELQNSGIGPSLISNTPVWFRKYFLSVAKFIENEVELLQNHLLTDASIRKEYAYDQEGAKNEAQGVRNTRITNVAITVDKLKHVMYSKKNASRLNKPPLRKLNPKEVIKHLWDDKDSLVNLLIRCLDFHDIDSETIKGIASMQVPKDKKGLKKVSELLENISKELRKMTPTRNCKHHAAADLLYLYSQTKNWFTSEPYVAFVSEPLEKGRLGGHYNSLKSSSKLCKQYQQQFVWGQLMFWMRQTIEKPNASLSAERRGTICLPDVACCYSQSPEKGLTRIYDKDTRNELFKKVRKNPEQPWSTKWHWKFRWGFRRRFYGTPWFDAILNDEKGTFEKLMKNLKSMKTKYPDL